MLRGLVCLSVFAVALLTGTASLAQPGGPSPSPSSTESRDDERSAGSPLRGIDVATVRGRVPEFVVVTSPNQSAVATAALTQAGARVLRVRQLPALNRHVLVIDPRRLSLEAAQAALAQVAPQSVVDLHHLYRYAQGRPRLFAAEMLGAPETGCQAPGMRIGIIDGPVNTAHASLNTARIAPHSVLGPNERPVDAKHGTAVAALIVGQDPSGGLAGFAQGATLFAASAFARERRGPAADVERIAAALDWLAGNRVRLVNMSFAGPSNQALDAVLAAAAARGLTMVAAVGNQSSAKAAYPAAAASVIAVTAVDAARRPYRAANTGAHVEFAAPGVDLYVAKRRGGTYASGTSYAAPIVTALAARLMQRGAGSTKAIRAGLRAGSADLGIPGRDTRFGWGLIHSGGC